jgi:hypothetical protein
MPLYVYNISYTDSREGDLRRTTEIGEDEAEAVDKAMDDYYFGKLIDVDKQDEATKGDIERYL